MYHVTTVTITNAWSAPFSSEADAIRYIPFAIDRRLHQGVVDVFVRHPDGTKEYYVINGLVVQSLREKEKRMIDNMTLLDHAIEAQAEDSHIAFLEKELDALDKQVAALKAENHELQREKIQLQAELYRIKRERALPADLVRPARLTLLREE